jgi:hypothetical protein
MTPLVPERGRILAVSQDQDLAQVSGEALAEGFDPSQRTFFERAIERNPKAIQDAIRNLALAEGQAAFARETAAQQKLDTAIRRDLFQSLGAGFRAGALGETESLERLTQAQFAAEDALTDARAETKATSARAEAKARLETEVIAEDTRVENLEREQKARREFTDTFEERVARLEAQFAAPGLADIEEQKEQAKTELETRSTEALIKQREASAVASLAQAERARAEAKKGNLKDSDLAGLGFSDLVSLSSGNQAQIDLMQSTLNEEIRLNTSLEQLEQEIKDAPEGSSEKRQLSRQLRETEARLDQFYDIKDRLLEKTVLMQGQQAKLNTHMIERAVTAEPAEVIAKANEFAQTNNTEMLRKIRPALVDKLHQLSDQQLMELVVSSERVGNIWVAKEALNVASKKGVVERPGPKTLSGGAVIGRGSL